tara:strand:- start:52 stop:441 length:390 start_codon:yes stop_codon:yes gene_type:complete
MALGKIKADTLEHSTSGSVDTKFVVEGSAKAWMRYNQATPAVGDSLNNSSVTDVSTGRFTFNYSSSFGNANYANNGCAGYPGSNEKPLILGYCSDLNITTSATDFRTVYHENTATDANNVSTSTLGDLA